jgi:L,D-transpeptidase catalytic domain
MLAGGVTAAARAEPVAVWGAAAGIVAPGSLAPAPAPIPVAPFPAAPFPAAAFPPAPFPTAPFPTAPFPAAPIPAPAVPAPGGLGAPPPAVPAPAAPPAPPKPAVPAKPAGVPCAATVRACIDLAHNKAWLLRGGVVEYGPVPITSGRPGYRTPVGTFRVLSKERLHLSRAFDNAPMPFSVFFIPGIAFHQGSLAVTSHGCIHLSKAAAIRFFGSLARGDVVQAVR